MSKRQKKRDGEPIAVIGGPPCQGFSVIGPGNADDPRNQLFIKFFELIREIQPVFFMAENVPGILNQKNDEVREKAIGLIENDYQLLQPICISAEEFGAPTKRKRVIFIGYNDKHFESIEESAFNGGNERVRVKEAFMGLPKRILSRWQSENQGWRKVTYPDSNSFYWRSTKGRVPRGVGDPESITLLKNESTVSGFLGTVHSEHVKKRFSRIKPGGHDKVSKSIRLDWEGYCPTIRAGTAIDKGSYQAVRPIHPTANRVISPREAARLQGFPDWFQFSGTKWHSFRQIGNSVCPVVAEKIIRLILNKRKK